MSYVLVAWEQPIPRSMEEVAPLVRALRADTSQTRSAAADAFMARLWQAFPRDLDGEDADYVWDDSFPFAAQPRQRLIHLAISLAHVDEVLPWVLQVARDTGLVVYDSELGTAWLPGGDVLGNPPQLPARRAPRPFDAKAGEKALLALLAAAFEPLGFEWVRIQDWDFRFVRRFDGGWQSIKPGIDLDVADGEVKVDYLLAAFLDAADPLLGATTGSTQAADAFVACCFLSGFIDKTGSARLAAFERARNKFVLRAQDDVRRFAEASSAMIVDDLLPVLDRYRSLASYGRHALARGATQESGPMAEPAVVRLAAVGTAAPERYDEIVRHELGVRDAWIAALEAMVPARPAQVASERAVSARIAAFAQAFRKTLR